MTSSTPHAPGAADSFDVRAEARSYRVDVAPGAADAALRALPRDALVISDEIFAARLAGLPCPVLTMPALETHKTLEGAARLLEAARAAGFTRRGTVAAVGGGIVQDVACFVASTYMRGVGWTYLPTTVLGMVDSCIGGKSSINVGPFKNLAGTIHPPDRVLVDPEFARTLPAEHRAGGLCEAAKIAYARGPDTFAAYLDLRAQPTMADAELGRVVALSLRAKQWFIEVDEFDRAERLTLNFGHTFGHALESASGFAINHGAAVGVGMLCALDFSLSRALVKRSAALRRLEEHTLDLLDAVPDLKPALERVDMARFTTALLSDKKHAPDALTLVLPMDASPDGLPLALCRLPRDADVLAGITRAVERTRRMMVG